MEDFICYFSNIVPPGFRIPDEERFKEEDPIDDDYEEVIN
jgi:hypothetical protein